MSADDLLGPGSMLSAHCRPLQQQYSGQPLILPDMNDMLMMGGMAPPGTIYLPGQLMCDDPAVMAGYVGANPNYYPLTTPTDTGMMDPCCAAYGLAAGAMMPEQVTLMQKLQLERRRRVYEYQQRKRLESAAEHWPGFESAAVAEPIDSIWERTPSPSLWSNNGSTFNFGPGGTPPLQQQQLPVGSGKARPASADLWNTPASTAAAEWGATTTSSNSAAFGIWGSGNDSGAASGADGHAMATGDLTEDNGASGAGSIFDPFNSLEMNKSIWNPNNTVGSSGVSGWASSTSGGGATASD
jgi:hypothetical protein